jgi:hypothetical protein
MELKDLKLDNTRQYMVDVHGKKYPIKQQRGRFYIQHATGQLTVTSVIKKPEYAYNVFFHYYLEGLQETHRCIVQDWWLEMSHQKRYIPFNYSKQQLQKT